MEASTVRIEVVLRLRDGKQIGLGSGSGFIVDGNHIVTNAHVALGLDEAASEIAEMQMERNPNQDRSALERSVRASLASIHFVVRQKQQQSLEGQLVWVDRVRDLAILRLSRPTTSPAVTIAPRQYVELWQSVYAVGFPSAADQVVQEAALEPKGARGIISALVNDREFNRQLYQTDALINPGNSGGPLFNECGEVVGVNTLGARFGTGINYAVLIDEVLPSLRAQGISYRTTTRGCNPVRDAQVAAEARVQGATAMAEAARVQAERIRDELKTVEGKSAAEIKALQDLLAEAQRTVTAMQQELQHAGAELAAARESQRWTMLGTVVAALIALSALGLALTRRGRVIIKEAVTRTREAVTRSRPEPRRRPAPGGLPRVASPGAATVPMARRRAVLRGESGEFEGKELPLDARPLVLGRDPALAQLVFATVATVSKRHCELRYDEGRGDFILQDLDSSNGTYLASGEALRPGQPLRLRAGDRFYVGDRSQLFRVELV